MRTTNEILGVWYALTTIQKRCLAILAERGGWVSRHEFKRELRLTSIPQASLRTLEIAGLAESRDDGTGAEHYRVTPEGAEAARAGGRSQ